MIFIIEFKIKNSEKYTFKHTGVAKWNGTHSSISKTRNVSIFASAVGESNSIKTTRPYCLHIVN